MRVLTFGEVMLRLKPPESQRIVQTDRFEATYGGAEANVASSLSILGNDVAYLSKVPDNFLGTRALQTLRGLGVNIDKVLRGGERLGIYFFEKGASLRATSVVYDRAHSSFAQVKASEFDWPAIFQGVDYFYFSGITPAISVELANACLAACQYCQAHDIPVVCGLNSRGKMWSPQAAQQVISQLMPYVTICIANDEDFEATLGIRAFDGNMANGIAQKQDFEAAMREVCERYPNVHMVASILRDVHSVEDSRWTALLYQNQQFHTAPVYPLHVWEGVASGDAFAAGLLHGLLHHYSGEELIRFGLAASVLKLTITGDINLVTEAEIRNVMQSGSGGRVSR